MTETETKQLADRLRVANTVPPSFDHLHDPDLFQRLCQSDIVVDDDGEDAECDHQQSTLRKQEIGSRRGEAVEPVRRKPMAGRTAPLPPTLPPRLISRDAAAAYVGVSHNTFDKMIADGLMPRPRQLTERRIAWDVRQLDAAIDRLPVDGGTDTDTDTTTDHRWDDIDAQAKTKPPVH